MIGSLKKIIRFHFYLCLANIVLDLVTQVRDVVFVNCIFSFGKPQGVGISERGIYGVEWENGEISLRATW